MLSRQQSEWLNYIINLALYNNHISQEEGIQLHDENAYVKYAITFGLPVREALTINLYHACVFNKLAVRYCGSSYYDPYYVLQEAQRVTNSLQYSLVLSHNFSINDAVTLCPDLNEKSRAIFKTISIFPSLCIEDAAKFSNSYQISILNDIMHYKNSSAISSDDIEIAIKFDDNYCFLLGVLLALDGKNSYSLEEYMSVIKQSLEFLPEQIDLLSIMLDDNVVYPTGNIMGDINNIVNIVKMIHPNNAIMKNAISIVSGGETEIDVNLVYKDIITDMKKEWYLSNVLEHYGFIRKVGEGYIISGTNSVEFDPLDQVSLSGEV